MFGRPLFLPEPLDPDPRRTIRPTFPPVHRDRFVPRRCDRSHNIKTRLQSPTPPRSQGWGKGPQPFPGETGAFSRLRDTRREDPASHRRTRTRMDIPSPRVMSSTSSCSRPWLSGSGGGRGSCLASLELQWPGPRIYCGAHWPSDIPPSVLIGIFSGFAAHRFADLIFRLLAKPNRENPQTNRPYERRSVPASKLAANLLRRSGTAAVDRAHPLRPVPQFVGIGRTERTL